MNDERPPLDLTCYLHEGWKPRIRPAQQRREWMDATPESFAYRCLPLNIANAHGWEVLSPCGFEAWWTGGSGADDVKIALDQGVSGDDVPVALFGQGVLTFHVAGLFRTPPGWNLWIGGPPNTAKDGVAPLGGVIETDWSPYSFTMNWRFTRPNQRIRFEENEPFCFFFPIERGLVERVVPRFAPLDDAPELRRQFKAWSRSRDDFHAKMAIDPPEAPGDKWQKLYYRGVDPDGHAQIADHRAKSRPAAFLGAQPLAVCPITQASPAASQGRAAPMEPSCLTLRKRDWLLATQQRLRGLSPRADTILRKTSVSPDAFLDEHYAINRPVVLGGVAADWPAASLWTPDYLKSRIGDAHVEIQTGRVEDPDFELNKQAHQRRMPFDRFIDAIEAERGNALYLTAFNTSANAAVTASLADELGRLDDYLAHTGLSDGMLWIGPEGTFTPLHHDLTNNLLVQIVGRKRVALVSPLETPRLYNDNHVFSRIRDIRSPDLDLVRFSLAAGVRVHELTLEPGDAVFIPVGWWHQVTSLSFSVSATYTNFHWPNDAHETYPGA